ncbi:MAG TPA: 1-deoxy-D-xylulose-5-phosphate reductoisomerase [Bacteroidales bacterium]|nr:1-deoxy-D-xylulose-5-phosphate reductoisomerase [Bacteroidales bacterium]
MTGKTKRIAVLGSTGSIGSQTLDVIGRFPDQFSVESLIAGNNVKLLVDQALRFRPSCVVINNANHYKFLCDQLQGTGIKIYTGDEAACDVVTSPDTDLVLASIVGYSGLRPTISAIKAGKNIALANKETLVVAGEIIGRLISQTGSRIIPVDSEHSAIFQCLAGETGNPVEKITLTASGGPFLNWTEEMLRKAKPQDALKHPNWDMGCKVTIDSASMMNKGLEVIEARWLFDLTPDRISVIIHPQSVIHSFVHFADGSVKAQLGVPDMRIPILYALTWPGRFISDLPKLRLADYKALNFCEPDTSRFRNLKIAYSALEKGGNMPCIMNAANETAVNSFLKEEIGFMQIPDVVEYAMEKCSFSISPDLETLEATDQDARLKAQKFINKLLN